jgi:hypothetical protein
MPKTAIPLLFVSGLSLATASKADADVVYTVLNPANNFTLFVYDSATFITTDTMVGVAQLAFANPLNPITGVDFIPSSSTFPGTSEVDLLQVGAPDQFRYYPQGTFTHLVSPRGTATVLAFPTRS